MGGAPTMGGAPKGSCERAAMLPMRAAVPAIAMAMVLGACASLGGGSAEAPANVNLAGTWKLDPQHSTDSRKALADLTKTARRETERERNRANNPGLTGFGPNGADAALLATPRMVFGPDLSLQRSLLANGDWLKIEQRPDEFVISNGETSRSYVPGERSVVSVPGGVADQRSGWKSHGYWISVKPQVGPSSTETFKLSPDGKQLIETIDIGRDGRVPAIKVTRVYVPTQEPPSALPSQD